MRENFYNMWALETFLEKRGVQNLLYCERKKWHSMVPSGNLETTWCDVGRRGECILCAGKDSKSHPLLKCPVT
jgi:hypothetical protein